MGQLRIIGGIFRGRKINFPDVLGVRPTPNRVRETLFNWLAPYIREASCLDLFAGSGALGFEAISRGASYVLMLDASQSITENLKKNRDALKFHNLEIRHVKLPHDLKISTKQFDIAFMDPPFNQGLIEKCSLWLENSSLLKSEAFVYLESEIELEPLPIPENWEILKNKKAGHVAYSLARRKID